MLGAFMRHWSIAIIAVASTVVFAQAASAADMPVKAVPPVSPPPQAVEVCGQLIVPLHKHNKKPGTRRAFCSGFPALFDR